MKTASKVAIALVAALLLAPAGVIAQSGMGGSTSPSPPEIRPADQGVALPLTRGEAPTQEEMAEEPKLIEAPAPGVPVDEQTYRELKERAKESR